MAYLGYGHDSDGLQGRVSVSLPCGLLRLLIWSSRLHVQCLFHLSPSPLSLMKLACFKAFPCQDQTVKEPAQASDRAPQLHALPLRMALAAPAWAQVLVAYLTHVLHLSSPTAPS